MKDSDLIQYSKAVTPTSSVSLLAPRASNADAQMANYGFMRAADAAALGADDAIYNPTSGVPTNLSDLAAYSDGYNAFAALRDAGTTHDTLQHIQAAAAGLAGGLVGTAGIVAGGVGGALGDAGAAGINALKRNGIIDGDEISHNYFGDALVKADELRKGTTSLIAPKEYERLLAADAAMRASRKRAVQNRVAELVANGATPEEAATAEIALDASMGADNFFSNSTLLATNLGDIASSLIGQRYLMKGLESAAISAFSKRMTSAAGTKALGEAGKEAVKAAAKPELGKWTKRGLEGISIGLTEGGSAVPEGQQEIDAMSDAELSAKSAEYRKLKAEYIGQGMTQAQAAEYAKTDLKRQAAYLSFGGTAGVATLAGAITHPIGSIGSPTSLRQALFGVTGEAIEEGVTEGGSQAINNLIADNYYDPGRNWYTDVGGAATEGALGGIAAAGATRSPFVAAKTLNDIFTIPTKKKQQTREELDATDDRTEAIFNDLNSKKASDNPNVEKTTMDSTIGSDSAENESDSIKVEVIKFSDKEQSIRFNNHKLDNPLEVQQEYAEKYSVDNNSAFSVLRRIRKDIEQVKELIKDDPAEENQLLLNSMIKDYMYLYEQTASRLKANREESRKQAEKLGITLGGAQEQFYDAYELGINDPDAKSIDSLNINLRDKEAIETAKTVLVASRNNTLFYNDLKQEIKEASDNALETGDLSEQSINNVASSVAQGDISPTDPKVLAYTARMSDETKESHAGRTLTAILNLVKAAAEEGIHNIGHANIRKVRQNLTEQSSLMKKSYSEAISLLSNALANNDTATIDSVMERLYKLAKSRSNKVRALQESLQKGGKNQEIFFESYNSATLNPYQQKVSAGSRKLYNTILDEEQLAVNVFNHALEAVRTQDPDNLTNLVPAKPAKRLKNENELLDKYLGPDTNKKSKSEPKPEQDEVDDIDLGAEPTPSNSDDVEDIDLGAEDVNIPTSMDSTDTEQTQYPDENVDFLDLSGIDVDENGDPIPERSFSTEQSAPKQEAKTEPKEEDQQISIDDEPYIPEDINSTDISFDLEDVNDTEQSEEEAKTESKTEAKPESKQEQTKPEPESKPEAKAEPKEESKASPEVKKQSTPEATDTPKQVHPLKSFIVGSAKDAKKSKANFANDIATDLTTDYQRDNQGKPTVLSVATSFNRAVAKALQNLFTERPNKSKLADIPVDNKLDAIKDQVEVALVDPNNTDPSKESVVKKDISLLSNFIKGFTAFSNAVIAAPSVAGNTSLNLNSGVNAKGETAGSGILEYLQKTSNGIVRPVQWLFGASIDPHTGKTSWENKTADRLISLFTFMNTAGKVVFNKVAQFNMGIAVLDAVQRFESATRAETREKVAKSLEDSGIDSGILNSMDMNDLKFFIYGQPVASLVNNIKRTWMDLMGIKSNPDISMSFDGDAAATAFADLGAKYLMGTGEVIFKRFVIITERNKNTDERVSYILTGKDAEKILNDKQVFDKYNYDNEQVYSSSRVFSYVIPATALNDTTQQIASSNKFQTPEVQSAVEKLIQRSESLDVVYTEDALPKQAPDKKLRSNTPNTELEKEAIQQRTHTAYYLDKGILGLYKLLGLKGLRQLNKLIREEDGTFLANVDTAASLEGKDLNLRLDYELAMERADAAEMFDSDNPRMYVPGNMHRAGRYQETAPFTTQGSKLLRYLFSNVKSALGLKNEKQMIGFKRAFLQAFDLKIKKISDTDVDSAFNKAVQVYKDIFGSTDITQNLDSISTEKIQQAFDAIGASVNGSPANVYIALSALVNMGRYLNAMDTGADSFINTLPIEFDGSCNGFANSNMKYAGGAGFFTKLFKNLFRSQMDFGLGTTDSVTMSKVVPEDNYTGNAKNAEDALLNSYREITNRSDYRTTAIEDKATNTTVRALDLFNNTISVVGLIMGKSFDLSISALGIKSDTDELSGESKLLSIARALIKGPTTRINYGQGKKQAIVQLVNEISSALSTKFTDILKHPNVPPYKTFFKEELASGKFTEEDAMYAYEAFFTRLRMLNMFATYTDSETDSLQIASNYSYNDAIPLFKANKDVGLTPEEKAFFTEYSLKSSASNLFVNNIKTFYGDVIYDALDGSRLDSYKHNMQLLISSAATAAEMAKYEFEDKLYSMVNGTDNQGLLPSQSEINQLRQEMAKKYPSVVKTKGVAIDTATTSRAEVEELAHDGRKLTGLKVNQGPYKGTSVPATLHYPVEIQSPAPDGVAPNANLVIASGDGLMQTLMFTAKDKNGNYILNNAADRYDGIDVDPADYYSVADLANRSVYDTLDDFPFISLIANYKKFVNAARVGLGITNSSSDEELSENSYYDTLVESLENNDSEYKKQFHKVGKENTSPEKEKPTPKKVYDYLENKLETIKEATRNMFISSVVLKSLPTTINHMSSGPSGYTNIDPRDKFYFPDSIVSIEDKIALITAEANRRYKILSSNENIIKQLWKEFNTTGKVTVPDIVYENSDEFPKKMEGMNNGTNTSSSTVAVSTKPDPISRRLNNIRTPDRTISASAPIAEAPKRQVVPVDTTKSTTTSDRKGRLSPDVQNMVSDVAQKMEEQQGPVQVKSMLVSDYLNQGVLNPNNKSVGKIKYLAKRIEQFFTKFVNANLPNGTMIKFYKSKGDYISENKLTNDSLDVINNPNVRAIYKPTADGKGEVIIFEDQIEASSPIERSTIILHEIVHAVSYTKLRAALNDTNNSAHKFALELRKYMNAIGNNLWETDPELYEKYRETIWENPEEDAAILEFIAYALTEPELVNKFSNKEFSKTIDSSSQSKFFRGIFNKIREAIYKIFNLKTNEDKTLFANLWGRLAANSIAVIASDAVETDSSSDITYLAYSRKNSNDVNLHRLASRIDQVTKNLLLKNKDKLTYADKMFQRRQETYANIRMMAITSNMKMTRYEAIVASALADLFSAEITLNPNSHIDAFNLRKIVIDNIKPEQFYVDSDDGNFEPARARYDFLMGLLSPTDMQVGNKNLGLFMGLASTSPLFREVLNKAFAGKKLNKLITSNEFKLSNSTIDNVISSFGESALQHINTILDFSGNPKYKTRQATDLIDQVTYSLLALKKDLSVLDIPTETVASLDDVVSNGIDKAATKFFNSNVLEKMLNSDNAFANGLASLLHYSVPLLMKDSNVIYKQYKQEILDFVNKYSISHPGFLGKALTTAYKELMSADNNADIIFEIEKIAKATIQANRTTWREVVPRKIKEMFSNENVNLQSKDLTDMNTILLKSDLGCLSNATIHAVMSGKLDLEIHLREHPLKIEAIEESQKLAKFLATGKASHGMLRNARAIAKVTKEESKSAIKNIDELVTLYALKENSDALKNVRDIYFKAPKAFAFSLAQQRANTKVENQKASEDSFLKYNVYKGYFPRDVTTPTNVRVVPLDAVAQYKSIGYEEIGKTSDKAYVYMQSSTNPITTFNQGSIQSVISRVGGIDATTGWTPSSQVYKRFTDNLTVTQLYDRIRKGKVPDTYDAFLPVISEDGFVQAYEVAVNPDMFANVSYETDFSKNLGTWKGRQLEEKMGTELNKATIAELKRQYNEASPAQKKQYVDVVKAAETDPVLRDALHNLPISAIYDLTGGSYKLSPKQFYVRQDLLDDVLGRRQASVIDFATGQSRWSPKTQRQVVELAQKILGPKAMAYLYKSEIALKSLSAFARNTIVIKSGEVMLMNLAGNILSLLTRGVPLLTILKETPRIVKELENYNHSRQREAILAMEINAEQGKDNPSKHRLNMLMNKLQSEQQFISSLPYSGELIKRGEYNTIADLGDTNDDILLSTGKWGEYLENKVKSLPPGVKEVGRQLILTKDSAIYRALEKGTQYGDFIAKAILYKHLTEKKGLSKEQALSRVRHEFVNYDMLAGRSREYLENIGLLWFYNYKLRITRIAFSMLKDNPVHSLISMFAPFELGIGTPITDNLAAKAFNHSLSGSVGPKMFDFPWVTNHLWYTLFS